MAGDPFTWIPDARPENFLDVVLSSTRATGGARNNKARRDHSESDAEPPVTTFPAILVGLRLVRSASLIRTLIDCTGSPPALSGLLEPTSQQTRLRLSFGCHRSHLLRMDALT